MLRSLFRSVEALRQPVPNIRISEWLQSPTIESLPDTVAIDPLEVSRVLSTISSRMLGPIPAEYMETCLNNVTQYIRSHKLDGSEVASAIHILDRVAAFHTVSEFTPDFVSALIRHGPLKVSKTDAFLGARAGLMLGHPELAMNLLTSSHCKSLSLSNLIQLATLSLNGTEVILQNVLGAELVSRLENSECMHSCSSADLVSAVKTISVMGVSGNSKGTGANITRVMKKAGTELVRRVELRTVSPHSVVDMIVSFSGQPPCPIHPLLLQGAFAYLLEDRRYSTLSASEVARVLHASSLAEIENTVLTQALVARLVSNDNLSFMDPRSSLRALSGLSLSRSFVHSACIRTLSCESRFSKLRSQDDIGVLTTALTNLAEAGVCRSTVDWVVGNTDVDKLDLASASSLLLLLSVFRGLPRSACQVVESLNEIVIPEAALEITEKANPALPRSDIKKKRLSKRVEKRFSELQSQSSDMEVQTKACDCFQATKGTDDMAVILKVVDRCLRLVCAGPDPSLEWKETERSAQDIVSSLILLTDADKLHKLSTASLKQIDSLVEGCMQLVQDAEEPALGFDEDTRDIESSVVRTVNRLCVGAAQNPVITSNNMRVTLAIGN